MIERKLLAFSLVVLGGCSSNPPIVAPLAPPASPSAGGAPQTDAQVTIGHFRSPDGMVGLVLDRTHKPKLKVDGQSEIVELTQKDDRDHGTLRGYILEAPDGKHPIYITLGGSIRYPAAICCTQPRPEAALMSETMNDQK